MANDNSLYIQLIEKLKEANNENTLKNNYTSLLSDNEIDTETDIIYNVFLVYIYSNEADSLNLKSEKLIHLINENLKFISNKELVCWVNSYIGFYYYTYNNYEKSLDYFIQSSRYLDEYKHKLIIDPEEVLKKNAYFFSTIKNYSNSINYLKRALSYTDSNSKNMATFLNNIGQSYFELNKLDSAKYYYYKGEKYALQNKDSIRYAKILGDIARVYIKQNKNFEALELLKKDIAISQRNGDNRNIVFAKFQMIEAYLKQNNILEAEKNIKDAISLIKNKPYLLIYDLKLSEKLLLIAVAKKDISKELYLRRRIDSLQPIIEKKEGNEILNLISLKAQKEKIIDELEISKSEKIRQQITLYSFIAFSILLMGIIFLVYKLYNKKLKLNKTDFDNKILSYKLDKIKSEKKLSEAKLSIDSIKVYLNEKNSQIEKLEADLEFLNKNSKSNTSLTNINELLSSHLMTQENWLSFKNAFINEQPDFYNFLINNFPDLTDSNIRIILLQKIGLNNIEISKILGVTVDAVKKAKQRLSKKYEIPFEDFLKNAQPN